MFNDRHNTDLRRSALDAEKNTSPVPDKDGGAEHVIGVENSATERDRAEAALRESEERFRSLTEMSVGWYWEQDRECRFTLILGGAYAKEQFPLALSIGRRRWEIPGIPLAETDWAPHKAALMARQPFTEFVYPRIGADGTLHYFSISGVPLFDAAGNFRGYRGTGLDITERRRAQQLLALEHQVARCLAGADNASEAMRAVIRAVCETENWAYGRFWRVDEAAGVLRIADSWSVPNPAIERHFESSRGLVAGPGVGLLGRVWQSGQPLWVADIGKDARAMRTTLVAATGLRGTCIFPVMSAGKTIGVLAFMSLEVREPDERLLAAARAIGSQVGQYWRRKHAEDRLRPIARARKVMAECNRALVRAGDEQRLLADMCRIAVETGGYRMAWAGFVRHDEARTIEPVASAGDDEHYLEAVRISWADSEFGRGPAGVAIRTGVPQTWRHTQTDSFRWREEMLARGHKATAALPLACEGVTLGVLGLHAGDAEAFDPEEMDLLVELANDIAYGVHTLRARVIQRGIEAELKQSEARFRSLTALSSDWYWEHDEHGRFTRISAGTPNGEVIPREMYLGKTRWELPGVRWIEAERAALEAEIEARRVFHDFEFGWDSSDGSRQYWQMSGEPMFDASGRYAGYRGVGKDVTERKRRREHLRRFRMAMDATADAIYIVDRASLRYIDVNAAACRMQNRTREEMLALGPEGVFSTSREKLQRAYDLVIASGADTEPVEMPRRRQDGSQAWIEIRHRAQRSENGWIIVSVARDITERKQAEAARRELEAQLRESQKMEAVGTLAGGIAHDFNNILAAILGNAALAKKDVIAGQVAGALVSLEEIDKAGGRARDLVQQILAFSRRQPQNFAIQPLRSLVEEALRLLRATLPAGVELAAAFADTPLHARADATQIGQVMVNLCTNAWQALQSSRGHINVSLDEAVLDAGAAQRLGGLAPGRYARLAVKDNGCGMDKATQARMFEPFYTTKPVDQGTGLGLAIVHGIVKAHQGAISVRSAPGKGTMVEVLLPVVEAPAQAAQPAPEAKEAADGQGKHVLYVDDDEAMVFLVRRMLENLGYRVSGFDRGEAALAAVRGNPGDFDLIVTDFNMPGLSGLEVAEALQRIRPELPVVITSGYISDELTAGARAAGVRQVVYKPNTVDELCATIGRLLTTDGV